MVPKIGLAGAMPSEARRSLVRLLIASGKSKCCRRNAKPKRMGIPIRTAPEKSPLEPNSCFARRAAAPARRI
ncbi:MAG: hypothetical protein JWN58_839 [Gammaproteobacteria bacterium]|nr:hypothetical protein [Gammaproteobacteria bacterium]